MVMWLAVGLAAWLALVVLAVGITSLRRGNGPETADIASTTSQPSGSLTASTALVPAPPVTTTPAVTTPPTQTAPATTIPATTIPAPTAPATTITAPAIQAPTVAATTIPATTTTVVQTTRAPTPTPPPTEAPASSVVTPAAAQAEPSTISQQEAEGFLRNYYDEVEAGDYAASWSRLTPEFQRGKARSYEYYTGFWDDNDIEIGDVRLVASDASEARVQAELRWNDQDNWITDEFLLRRSENGELLIAAQTAVGR
jgi:hypothetical protein